MLRSCVNTANNGTTCPNFHHAFVKVAAETSYVKGAHQDQD